LLTMLILNPEGPGSTVRRLLQGEVPEVGLPFVAASVSAGAGLV